LHVEDDVRTEVSAELLGVVLLEADLGGRGVCPQLARDQLVVRRQPGLVGESLLAGECPATLATALVAALAALGLAGRRSLQARLAIAGEGLYRDAVDARQARHDDRNRFDGGSSLASQQ